MTKAAMQMRRLVKELAFRYFIKDHFQLNWLYEAKHVVCFRLKDFFFHFHIYIRDIKFFHNCTNVNFLTPALPCGITLLMNAGKQV